MLALPYADHPDFQQTNVISGFLDQSTGGVTESLRNRVIMPFTGVYAENDHVLGHELVHVLLGARQGRGERGHELDPTQPGGGHPLASGIGEDHRVVTRHDRGVDPREGREAVRLDDLRGGQQQRACADSHKELPVVAATVPERYSTNVSR